VGEPFRFITSFDVANTCFKAKDSLEEVYDLVETPLEGHVMCLCIRTFKPWL